MGVNLLTASRKAAFERCQREEYNVYQLGYRPREKAKALDYGTLVHVGLECWWGAWETNPHRPPEEQIDPLQFALDAVRYADTDLDEYTLAEIEVLLVGYHAHWSDKMAGLEVVAVEAEFRAPLTTPSGKATGWDSGGKLDVVFSFKGRKFGMEHKTTSSSIAPGSSYLTRLRIDAQISAYFDGAAALDHELEAFYYDVLVKPNLRPKKATDDVKMTLGRKCATQAKPCDGDHCERCKGTGYKELPRPRAGQQLEDETVEEFRGRVKQWIVDKGFANVYHRERIVRLGQEMDAARADWLATAQRIETFMGASIPPPRSPSACHRYGRPCAFWGVCTGTDSLESDNFVKSPIHPELQEVTR